MFSLALHDVISKLGSSIVRDNGWMVFYLDDGTVHGSIALLDLRLNSQKSLIITASAVDTVTHLSQLSLVDPSNDNSGFKVLGVPLGGKNYVQTELQYN